MTANVTIAATVALALCRRLRRTSSGGPRRSFLLRCAILSRPRRNALSVPQSVDGSRGTPWRADLTPIPLEEAGEAVAAVPGTLEEFEIEAFAEHGADPAFRPIRKGVPRGRAESDSSFSTWTLLFVRLRRARCLMKGSTSQKSLSTMAGPFSKVGGAAVAHGWFATVDAGGARMPVLVRLVPRHGFSWARQSVCRLGRDKCV